MKVPIPWAPLYPSQISGETSLELARWRGDWREFWVQWHEDRVYFQLTHGEPTVWASLETCAPDEAIACFEDAVCQRRYGACFIEWAEIHRSKNPHILDLQFIFALDGTGFLREWHSPDWITFAPKQTRGWIWFPELLDAELHSPHHRDYCRYAANNVYDEILMRRVTEKEIERLSWRSRTNKNEFKRIMLLLWNAQLLRFPLQQRRFANVSLQSCLPETRDLIEAPDSTTAILRSHLSLPAPFSDANAQLLDWLQTYFVGEGFEWRTTDWGKRQYRKLRAREPHLRAFFEPNSIYWGVRFGDRSDPSFHQQLEARLQLRAWLLDRATPSQVETFLRAD